MYDPEEDRIRIVYNLKVGRIEPSTVVRWLMVSTCAASFDAYLVVSYAQNHRQLDEMQSDCKGVGPHGLPTNSSGSCVYVPGTCLLDSADDGKSAANYTFVSPKARVNVDFNIGRTRGFQPADLNARCDALVWRQTVPYIVEKGQAIPTDSFFAAHVFPLCIVAMSIFMAYPIYETVTTWRMLRKQPSKAEIEAMADSTVNGAATELEDTYDDE